MNRNLVVLALALLVALLQLSDASSARAEMFDVTILPREQDAFGKALYRLWIPEGLTQVRAIIFRQHGCGEGARKFGLEHAHDIQWQAFARKWDCALMGSQLWAPEEDCSTWTIPADGSDHAFHAALEQFAEKSGHAEIATAPWLLWGHSGGAMWVTNMTYRHPERIVATFPRSGGLAPAGREFKRNQPAKPDSNPKAFDVPVMFCYGETENVEGTRFYAGVQGTHAVYDVGREHGAPWAVAEHPGSNHENGNSRLLAIRFFDAALGQRLPKKAGEELAAVDASRGWLGDPGTKSIQPASKVPAAQRENFVWLLDETLARAWKEFSETGHITDRTPPPAPTNVVVGQEGSAVVVTFDAAADPESGIQQFNIYRDGKPIGRVAGEKLARWNETAAFHAWNYSDQPIPESGHPAMHFEDKSDGAAATAKYTVSTVNRSGLESEKVGPSN
ncbi:MAG: hypothetical protein RIC55_30665 [Pirellulaceae bacterium]